MGSIKIKRVYDRLGPREGKRILIDRLWPRGLRKDVASIDLWEKEIAPTPSLRRWLDHRADRFHVIQATLPRRTEIEACGGRELAANGPWQDNIGICSA
jgi:uncharacterized protein YeaO (DUF488 family)